MKKSEMKSLIFGMLEPQLAGTDFRLRKVEDAFVRRIPNGRQMLGLPLWDYNPEFEFSLNICVRLDAAEAIFHRFSGAEPKYHSMSFTTMTRLEYFTGTDARYRVATKSDVDRCGEVPSPIIRERIVPFFDEHQDVVAVDEAVNHGATRLDITHNPSGAMHAVILSHLAKSGRFEQVVARKRAEMQLGSDVSHPFNEMVRYLTSGDFATESTAE